MVRDIAKSSSGFENDSTGITESCPGCGRPHTERLAKLKISH